MGERSARGPLIGRDFILASVLAVVSAACGGPVAAPDVSLRVPDGFRPAPGARSERYTETGWAGHIVHEKTGIELVFIPAGDFLMGSPEDEAGRRENEGPQHRVVISKPFYLGRYEVTQEQWLTLMDTNPSRFRGDDNPVNQMTWYECQEFLSKAGDGLRLPTEAEWEYACRAGSTTRYHFGDSHELLGDYAWYDGNSGGRMHPVGGKKPNAWGLYDMHGNAWEWCADYIASYEAAERIDPQGPASGTFRVRRGGSWGTIARLCRSAWRDAFAPKHTYGHTGFRVARTAE